MDVVGLDHGVVVIAAGSAQTCTITDSAGVKCWGKHFDTTGGNGSSRTPVDMQTPPGVKAIAKGSDHICILTQAGGVECWGNNAYGQVGALDSLGKNDGDVALPVDVTGLSGGVLSLSAGSQHTCALMQD